MTPAHFLQLGGFKLLCTKEEITEGLIESALSEKADFMGMSRRAKAWGRFFIQYYLSFHSPHHPRFVEGVRRTPMRILCRAPGDRVVTFSLRRGRSGHQRQKQTRRGPGGAADPVVPLTDRCTVRGVHGRDRA